MGKYTKIAKALAKERMRLKKDRVLGRLSLSIGQSARIQSPSQIEGGPRVMKLLNIVKNSSIRKLMYRGGVKLAAASSYIAAKAELMDFMAEILKDADLYRDGTGRKTIMKTDIDAALQRRGLTVYG